MLTQNFQDKTRSTIIKKSCPFCGKVASEVSVEIFNLKRKAKLACGHTVIEKLEDSLLTRHQNIEELSTERELTKMAVDDLIKSIDTIVNREHEQS